MRTCVFLGTALALNLDPSLSFTFPLTDRFYDEWDCRESSVALNSSVILLPERRMQFGYLASKSYLTYSQAFDFELDFAIQNS